MKLSQSPQLLNIQAADSNRTAAFECSLILVYHRDSQDIRLLKKKVPINQSAIFNLAKERNTRAHAIPRSGNSESHSLTSLVQEHGLAEVVETEPKQKEQNEKMGFNPKDGICRSTQ